MKKIKAFLAFALAVSMCVSTAACGKADESEKDDTEKEVTTSAAESVAEETNSEAAQAESVAETEAVTTENTDESSVAEEAETSEAEPEQSAEGISFTELEPFFTEIAGKDIDTAETILRNTLSITSERNDIYGSATDLTFHEFDLPDDITICGIDFDHISLNTKDDTITGCSLLKEYEYYPEEEANAIKDKLDNIGYTEASDVQEKRRIADYNTDYGRVYVTLLTNSIVVNINDLH